MGDCPKPNLPLTTAISHHKTDWFFISDLYWFWKVKINDIVLLIGAENTSMYRSKGKLQKMHFVFLNLIFVALCCSNTGLCYISVYIPPNTNAKVALL